MFPRRFVTQFICKCIALEDVCSLDTVDSTGVKDLKRLLRCVQQSLCKWRGITLMDALGLAAFCRTLRPLHGRGHLNTRGPFCPQWLAATRRKPMAGFTCLATSGVCCVTCETCIDGLGLDRFIGPRQCHHSWLFPRCCRERVFVHTTSALTTLLVVNHQATFKCNLAFLIPLASSTPPNVAQLRFTMAGECVHTGEPTTNAGLFVSVD